jgi:HAD superfamily phosphoserine phosphatase-like hydrolase
MTAARTPPEVPQQGAPVSLLVDYDGTISRDDIGDALLARHFPDAGLLAAKDADFNAGRRGSRELMRWDMDVLPHDAALLWSEATAMAQDDAFPAFVAAAEACGAAVEIVSDGLGFYLPANLGRLGLERLPVAANENRVAGGGAGLTFPYSHPACFVCGTCKRERVRAHQALDRAVVFIGDGMSDRYAAFHADVVLAKGLLARFCADAAWPFQPWLDFRELTAWLARAWGDGTLPREAAGLPAWRRDHPSMAARVGGALARAAEVPQSARGDAFICGPEAWGPGRETPLQPPS